MKKSLHDLFRKKLSSNLQIDMSRDIDYTAQKSFLRIWSHLLKKSLMENFIFCPVLLSVNVCEWESSCGKIH